MTLSCQRHECHNIWLDSNGACLEVATWPKHVTLMSTWFPYMPEQTKQIEAALLEIRRVKDIKTSGYASNHCFACKCTLLSNPISGAVSCLNLYCWFIWHTNEVYRDIREKGSDLRNSWCQNECLRYIKLIYWLTDLLSNYEIQHTQADKLCLSYFFSNELSVIRFQTTAEIHYRVTVVQTGVY